jgi:S-adenosyl methyltransferase
MAREDRSRRRNTYPPEGVDAKSPNIARVYDAFLGGKDNFAADRQVVEAVLRVAPDAPAGGQANRAFLRRVVRYLVRDLGITQILDIGSGLPTQGNVHEVAREINPSVRTIYVDNDPVVCIHGQALLADARTTEVITADARRPAEILDHPVVRQFIDFRQPVALLLLGLLHHLSDDEDPSRVVATLRDAVPRGSYLVISSFRMPGPELAESRARAIEMEQLFNEQLGTGRWRSDAAILAWFGDWELTAPGLVPLWDWRPDKETDLPGDAIYQGLVGGVARKA